MGRWLLVKVGRAVLTLIGVVVAVFVILRAIPGDQITASLGVSAGLLTKAQIEALDRFYGIGQPVWVQFGQWAGQLVQGNLGISIQSGRPVATLIAQAWPVTLELAVLALLIGLLLGIGAGVLAASAPGKWGDWLAQAFALFGLGVPGFVIGAGLVAFFAAVFHYFPSSLGYTGLLVDPGLNLQQMIFPALVLGISVGAAVMRTTRGAMLEVARLDFVRSARGKGLSHRAVIVRHVLRNALMPVVTMSGIQFGYLLGGTVILEQIFVLPGLGRLLLTAINEHDYAVAQGVTLIFAAGFILVNLITEALYLVIDPRVRT
ncbi:MAG: ABC transporter permease [Candidatus Dormibacteraeota bacterium]|nr:ABC transporter permease [Candidatus Dormibacteraeota bacterium]